MFYSEYYNASAAYAALGTKRSSPTAEKCPGRAGLLCSDVSSSALKFAFPTAELFLVKTILGSLMRNICRNISHINFKRNSVTHMVKRKGQRGLLMKHEA